jgi:signal transduction histidine kinase
MLMPASAEFAALCQSQIAMMAQLMGADSTAVYLAESWTEQALPKLIPIAIYPPAASTAQAEASLSQRAQVLPKTLAQLADGELLPVDQEPAQTYPQARQDPLLLPYDAVAQGEQAASQQLAIPLIHEGGIVGILVGWRADRPWQEEERRQMEECARSLTLACVLDQRGQWLRTQLSSLDRVQTQQSDRFHELLHQLRSPLTALKTFGKLLTKRLSPDNPNQALVINMLRESDRMQELLGYFDETLQAADETREEAADTVPLLTPAREDDTVLEAAAHPISDSLSHFGGVLKLQNCPLNDLIRPLVESTQTLAEAVDMTLHIFPPPDDVTIRADAKALIEILSNFLDNALKYSHPGAHVWVEWGLARADHPHLSGIVVGDTGPGIPPADQPHIFERHYRGIQDAGPLAGSGLGLAIAADLVQEMHGQVEVHSPLSQVPELVPLSLQGLINHPGTAFVIWLPQTKTDSGM